MIYIRNLFKQDLRDGKQIAFPSNPSNYIFKFSFKNQDPDRNITFKFRERDNTSQNFIHNNKIIKTRLYSAGSESRIDSELKQFLINVLGAEENDIILIRPINIQNYEFEFFSKNINTYNTYNTLLNGDNHEIIVEDQLRKDNTNDAFIDNLLEKFTDWFILKDGITHNYYKSSFSSNREKVVAELNKYEELYKQEFNSSIFQIENEYLNLKISEIENNIYKEEGLFFEFSKKISRHMPRAILGKNNYLRFLLDILNEKQNQKLKSTIKNPINKIYFGAPGTGKSFQITKELRNVDIMFQKRITFHPEFDNSGFVGGYKPITDIKGDVKYQFVPQIFTNIYVEACNNPNHHYYLIIEEINRGNCAEIFGELFQLLDRDTNYKITPSHELINHLNQSILNSKFYNDGKMLLPENLSILATMNTSDQSLFPMDSAFKRRWEWEYVPINYSIDSNVNPSILYNIRIDDLTTVNWINFINKINLRIQDNPNLGMDKCIGNYFVKPDANNDISLSNFIYKVIFYLWNDVFKDEPMNSIFKGNITYQDFFPINENGKKLIKMIFEDLELTTTTEIVETTNTQA